MANADEYITVSSEPPRKASSGLRYLPHWPPVNIEFQDLVYTVTGAEGKKCILRGVSGSFKSGELTAIMGPSGAGKSTLLNVLAGLRQQASGMVKINNKPRDLNVFRKMSRYIMQEDVHQKLLTVREGMMIAADLKLGPVLTKEEKLESVNEILDLLRLTKAADTMGNRLSGGERKRLSIALELVNNPPVVFLDEPTTGLDDLSCSQCIALLQRIARGGRTVICSIHTPSAKIFAMFDHVYALADGYCVYQGHGSNIVSYMSYIGLECPLTYNPADFIIEVSSGEYGREYMEKMIKIVKNGRCLYWNKPAETSNGSVTSPEPNGTREIEPFEEEIDPKNLKAKSTDWDQFVTLYKRTTKQMFRDKGYLKLKLYMHILSGLLVGGLFYQMGNDASKTLFNFGFCFTMIIAFMYIPMMPILLEFPSEVQLLKREHFNQWYRLVPYFFSFRLAKIPIHLSLALLYMTMVYFMTGQPIELSRIAMFYTISILIFLVSESMGLLVASRLGILSAMFTGPVVTVPVMLLAVYNIGAGIKDVPDYIRLLMSLSYLRYGLEGIIDSVYGHNRTDMVCPEEEMFCPYQKPVFLLEQMGFDTISFTVSAVALTFFYVFFNLSAFYLIRQRLSLQKSDNIVFRIAGDFLKRYMNFAPY